MGVNGVLRPGFAQLRVLDMKEALVHYRDRIGLDVVSQEKDGRVYLRAYDEFDRHSLVLREADRPGLDFFAFKVEKLADLDHFASRVRDLGLRVESVPPGEQPGLGKRVSFVLPTGHRIDLYAEIEASPVGPMTLNPDVWRTEPRGMRAQRFDHCLLYGPDIEGAEEVFVKALDFRLSEKMTLADGSRIGTFLSCSNKSHDVAFIRHPEPGKLHHVSFLLESWEDVGHAADLMTRYDISVDIGPTRHGVTRGQTIYFFDPSGNRNEVYANGYTYYPDHPTREWTGEMLGKGVFYYERALNDRFLGVVT